MKTELIKYLAAFSLLLSACATLKSKKVLHEQNLEVKNDSRESSSEQSWAKSNTLLLDTSNSEYAVQITPLGKFFYSAEKGFAGMAKKVVFKEKASHRRMMHKQWQNGHQLAQQKTRVKSTALKTKVQRTEKTGKGLSTFLWIGLGLTFCLTLGYRLIKKDD